MRSLAKALRPLFALGLLGVACAAQSGAAQAQGGLNDFFSQLFAPPPQPSYVQPLVVPRGGPLARPQRGYVPRSRSADRVSPVRLPRAVPFRVRHASLPAPKDQTSLPRRGEGKAESPKPIKIVRVSRAVIQPVKFYMTQPCAGATSSCCPGERRCSKAGGPRLTASATLRRFAPPSCGRTRPAEP
jgi:hypothetical protein